MLLLLLFAVRGGGDVVGVFFVMVASGVLFFLVFVCAYEFATFFRNAALVCPLVCSVFCVFVNLLDVVGVLVFAGGCSGCVGVFVAIVFVGIVFAICVAG